MNEDIWAHRERVRQLRIVAKRIEAWHPDYIPRGLTTGGEKACYVARALGGSFKPGGYFDDPNQCTCIHCGRVTERDRAHIDAGLWPLSCGRGGLAPHIPPCPVTAHPESITTFIKRFLNVAWNENPGVLRVPKYAPKAEPIQMNPEANLDIKKATRMPFLGRVA